MVLKTTSIKNLQSAGNPMFSSHCAARSSTVQAIAPRLYNNNNSVPSFQQPRTKPVKKKKKKRGGEKRPPCGTPRVRATHPACCSPWPPKRASQSLFLSGPARAVCSLRQNKQQPSRGPGRL